MKCASTPCWRMPMRACLAPCAGEEEGVHAAAADRYQQQQGQAQAAGRQHSSQRPSQWQEGGPEGGATPGGDAQVERCPGDPAGAACCERGRNALPTCRFRVRLRDSVPLHMLCRTSKRSGTSSLHQPALLAQAVQHSREQISGQ